MKLLFVADPLERFKTYKDTTYAMMREAAARGHALHSCEARELQWWRDGFAAKMFNLGGMRWAVLVNWVEEGGAPPGVASASA